MTHSIGLVGPPCQLVPAAGRGVAEAVTSAAIRRAQPSTAGQSRWSPGRPPMTRQNRRPHSGSPSISTMPPKNRCSRARKPGGNARSTRLASPAVM